MCCPYILGRCIQKKLSTNCDKIVTEFLHFAEKCLTKAGKISLHNIYNTSLKRKSRGGTSFLLCQLSVVKLLVGLENGTLDCVYLVVVLVACGLKLHLVHELAVIAVECYLKLSCLSLGDTCVL